MKDLIIPVNNEAHSRALVSVVGEETAQLVLRAYQAIDSAMVFGYERGLKEATQAQAAKDATDYKEAFNSGYDAGFAASDHDDLETAQELYNDGYIDGVSDARVSPSEADRIVASLCSEDDFYDDEDDIDYFDDDDFYEPVLNAQVEGASYEGDSCDENDAQPPVWTRRMSEED